MEFLSIAFKVNVNLVDSIFKKNLSSFEESNQIYKKIDQVGDTYIYNYYTNNKNYDNNISSTFFDSFSCGLVDVIFDIYKNKILNDKINSYCHYFDKDERSIIIHKIDEIIKKDKINEDYDLIQNRIKVMDEIKSYFENSDYMIIEGFINFRLKFFLEFLDNIFEKAIEEYFVEKEYNEFVKILRYFVEIQESKMDVINVVLERDGKYILYDDKDQVINNDYLEEIVEELSENDINYDDLLISSLITIAPKKVIMHIDEHRDLDGIIKIINNVFEDKVEICREFNFCSSIINKLKGILIKEK